MTKLKIPTYELVGIVAKSTMKVDVGWLKELPHNTQLYAALEGQPEKKTALSVDWLNSTWEKVIRTGDPTAGNAHLRFANAIQAELNC